jgi:enoyl-CoA hydratase/carnithine racemase
VEVTPQAIRVDGDWQALDADGRPAARFLAEVAAITIAVGDAPPDLPFDLRTHDPDEADRWEACIGRAPHALLAAALLLRDPPVGTWAGLVAESATYSMLQAGPEFRGWRERSDARPADDADAPRVRVDAHGRVAEVVLTRAGRHNALDVRMRDELYDALLALELGEAAAVIVRGEGPSFCSGGDLGEFGTFPDPATAHGVRLARSLALRFAALSDRMVVALHGQCLGSGIELAAYAARVIAADDAELGLPEASLGLVPGAGGTVSIPRRCGAPRLLELLVTGEPVGATTALAWGLVDEVVPRADLETRVREAASEVASSRGRAR